MKTVSEFLINSALTVKTHSSYNRAKFVYIEFLQTYFPGANPFPLDVEHIILFISYCYTKHLAPQTVTTYVSALGHFNKLAGYSDTTQVFVVRRALQGFKKLKGSPDVRLPITPSILRKLIVSLPNCTSSFYQCSLFKAMFLLAFHAFLRVGEITNTDKSKSVLPFSSIQFGKMSDYHTCNLTLTLSNFKHHQGQTPVKLFLSANTDNKDLCPVMALWEYCKIRGTAEGPLFMFQDKTPISRHIFSNQLQICLTFLGYDPKLYKSHSFRIGAATWAKSQGVSDERIQLCGRWKSDAYKKYFRIPLLSI